MYSLDIKKACLYISGEAPDKRKLFPRNMFDCLTLLAIAMRKIDRLDRLERKGERQRHKTKREKYYGVYGLALR